MSADSAEVHLVIPTPSTGTPPTSEGTASPARPPDGSLPRTGLDVATVVALAVAVLVVGVLLVLSARSRRAS